jgi:hypothetical protein
MSYEIRVLLIVLPWGRWHEVRLKVCERGRENGSFPVEEGNEVKDRVLETVGFQGANPICDGGGLV